MPERPLTILSVHAHPDDESSKGAATIAHYVHQGVRAVLVTATGGEEGDILNPAMESPEVRENLAAVRSAELDAATAIIGYHRVVRLGYRDSGMPDTPANARPEAFWNVPIEESTAALVRVIREEQPQVILTYGEDQSGYPHPDHLRVHDISIRAFELAGDPTYRPELGAPFQPLKLYYSIWSKKRMLALVDKFEELGIESPFSRERLEREGQDHLITTEIDIRAHLQVQRDALLAHKTQIDPESPFWFGLSVADQSDAFGVEVYQLAKVGDPSLTLRADELETDLFAGIPVETSVGFVEH
jgi:mycothiol S-conjugate amidase